MSVEREKRSGRTPGVKHGSTATALAGLSALALAALLLAWFWSRAEPPAGSAGPPEVGGTRAPAPEERAPAAGATAAARSEAASARGAPSPDDPDRFRGHGRIRGDVELEGVAMPERWTLVLEPHPTLVGADRAVRRRVEYEHGETRFDAADLPLGGYRLHAEAPALNSTRVSALLVRGSSDVHVTLRLSRAGLVDGFAFDHAGRAAEGLAVTIEDVRTRERTATEVDAAGGFSFRGVVDGGYRILFGAPERPLVPPGEFTFRAPTLRWPETRLPPTGSARITVRDERGAGILDARVQGSGAPQGALDGRTGGDGALSERYLWPARYEVRAVSPDGRSGRAAFDVAIDQRADVEITVR